MERTKISEYARALLDVHGDKAEFEAAQKAKQLEDANNAQEAETWRAVQLSIREMRGARQS
ncbi:hypothetical protein [Marinibacterium profundimaris]|uniref:Uncharacterized protein n=1 Tax=Marinibacterium profundimaris TaxID=1679460 RepID=A0A225NAG8_9RHOB|nr:hypothetical protein [Marinibacterium profundimaris]OWU66990.1 hypothetical protein ATO3_26880 [Marinibacterium profundimaris]